jgi:hypothetical protein
MEIMMRALLTGAMVALVAVAGPALAQDAKQDFKLVNKTGYDLKSIFIGPSSSEKWSPVTVDQPSITDGMTVNMHFTPGTKTCHWDLKVVYAEDDSSAVWQKIDLCTVEKITIKYDRNKDVTSATFD